MKKTHYFISGAHNHNHIITALEEICEQRDKWLNENTEIIGQVDNEDIKFEWYGTNNASFYLIIKLTYYTK